MPNFRTETRAYLDVADDPELLSALQLLGRGTQRGRYHCLYVESERDWFARHAKSLREKTLLNFLEAAHQQGAWLLLIPCNQKT